MQRTKLFTSFMIFSNWEKNWFVFTLLNIEDLEMSSRSHIPSVHLVLHLLGSVGLTKPVIWVFFRLPSDR